MFLSSFVFWPWQKNCRWKTILVNQVLHLDGCQINYMTDHVKFLCSFLPREECAIYIVLFVGSIINNVSQGCEHLSKNDYDSKWLFTQSKLLMIHLVKLHKMYLIMSSIYVRAYRKTKIPCLLVITGQLITCSSNFLLRWWCSFIILWKKLSLNLTLLIPTNIIAKS